MCDLCETIRKRLIRLHLTKLPVTDDPEVQSHLEGCLACRTYRDFLEHDHRELEGEATSFGQFVEDVTDQLQRRVEPLTPPGKPRVRISMGVVLLAVCVLGIGLVIFVREKLWWSAQTPSQTSTIAPPPSKSIMPNPETRAIKQEIVLARQHLQQGNLPALMELLNSKYSKVRVRAAQYLAQIGDQNVLPALERLAGTWDENTSANPFAHAMVQIERRLALAAASETLPSEPEPEPTMAAMESNEPNDEPDPCDLKDFQASSALPTESSYTVVGQFSLLNESQGIPWELLQMDVVTMPAALDPCSLRLLSRYRQLSVGQLRRWSERKQAEQQKKVAAWQLYPPDAQGYFSCTGLTSGHYALIGEMTLDRETAPRRQEARLWFEFKIPTTMNSSLEDTTIDVNIIALLPGDIQIGDEASDFDLQGLAGNRVRLTDYHGQLLLLSFYDTQFLSESSTGVSELKMIAGKFGSLDSFALLGMLSSDEPILLVRHQIESLDMHWSHALVGHHGQNQTHINYDVLNVEWPWNILVGPDGAIVAIGLRGDALLEAIAENLP